MDVNSSNIFEDNLNKFDENQWTDAVDKIMPAVHEVDRIPTQAWFRFYPLSLFRYIQSADNLDTTIRGFAMQGNYLLADQIDTSHYFLYGHRFWSDVKHTIVQRADSFKGSNFNLVEEINKLAEALTVQTRKNKSLFTGITAIGLMTLVQVGLETFRASNGDTVKPSGFLARSPEKVLAARKNDKKRGIFSFLKTIDKEFQITWDETKSNAKFSIICDEEITSGAARDHSQNWLERDERCIEGVIPVECRSAACGACWIGVIGGAEKLSDVQKMERKQMKFFGYKQGNETKPFMRLACQATAKGSASIVIPPWNGVFGKKVYGVEKVELEPATTSAVKLRKAIDEALNCSKVE